MSTIIEFPLPKKQQSSDLDAAIDQALSSIPQHDQAKLRFELLKMIDSYDGFFTEWSVNFSGDIDEALKKQIYDIARQEHERKILMLKDIIRLKVQLLVAEYHRHKH